jgi:hypothetical protein
VTFLSTVEDSGAAGTHTLVVRAIKLPSGSISPKVNFNIDNIGNLAKFDPYALSLTNNSALSLSIGDFGSFGNFSGTVAGYAPIGGVRNNAYIVTYTPPTVSASNDRSVNIIKALTTAGNKGSILDYFTNRGGSTSQGRAFVKSIEVFSGDEIKRGAANSRSTNQPQQRKPDTSSSQEDSTPSEDSNDTFSTQCAENEQVVAECKDS